MSLKTIAATLATAVSSAAAVSIAEINGNRFLSPLANSSVTGVEGLVTAIGPNGAFIRSTEPDDDDTTSDSIYVFSRGINSSVAVGDIITLDGEILEYR